MSAKFPRGGGSKPILSHPSMLCFFPDQNNRKEHIVRKFKSYAKTSDSLAATSDPIKTDWSLTYRLMYTYNGNTLSWLNGS